MITLCSSILCTKISRNDDSRLPNLEGIVTGVTVQMSSNSDGPDIFSQNENVKAIPLNLQLFTIWQRTESDKKHERELHLRIRMQPPNNKKLIPVKEQILELDFDTHPVRVVELSLVSIPVISYGLHSVLLDIKQNNRWKNVGKSPLIVFKHSDSF